MFGQSLRAQDLESRTLFIFDTSSDMKSRIKAEQLEINQLLSTGLSGQLHEGDSVGVWTFDQTLHAGQFPLISWAPDGARDIANSINKFVGGQHYSGNTSFAALQPMLDRIIQSSPRLTVVIFCDGDDAIKWTPYNDGVNQLFQERSAAQKHDRQPFILLIRTQLGQYVGCTMNFPPGTLNLPDFPPPPAPPQPKPAVAQPVKPTPPPQTLPPLIIVGTNIMDHEPAPEIAKPTNAPSPAVMVTNVVTQTNTVMLTETDTVTLTQTNTVTVTNIPPPPKAAPPADAPHFSGKVALAVGAGLLVAAVALIAMAASRRRNSNQSSLITRSMRKD